MKQTSNKIIETLLNARYVLVISHFNPDADTLGTSLALCNYLKENKIKHKLYNQDKNILPRQLDFLNLFDKITDQIPPFYDVAVYIDSANIQRTGFEAQNCKIINIDHHRSNDLFGDINFVYPEKSSTAEVLYEVFEASNCNISKNTAQCLYVALYDDSQGFTTPRVNSKTFKILDNLMQTGLDIGYISDQYKRRESLAKLRILPLILQTLQLHCEGKIATIYLEENWLKQTGAQINECDDAVDMCLNMAIVQMVLYFRIVKGKVRVSLRSKGDLDVSTIAGRFEGEDIKMQQE